MKIFRFIKQLWQAMEDDSADEDEILKKLEVLNAKVQALTDMGAEELQQHLKQLDECIGELQSEVEKVVQKNSPGALIRSGWIEGAHLSEHSQTLAHHLEDKALPRQHRAAASCWVNAVLAVNSHYHHLVGPAMIYNARLAEEDGELELAQRAYSAVIQDFSCLLDGKAQHAASCEADSETAIDCLEEAARRYAALGGEDDVTPILERIELLRNERKKE